MLADGVDEGWLPGGGHEGRVIARAGGRLTSCEVTSHCSR
jgi:hypothetical protein